MAEARELNHSYVGTEHLLLGLLREEKGLAAKVLGELGIGLEEALFALQTLAAIDRMKPFVASMYDLELDIRIGLHHGEALLGEIQGIVHLADHDQRA